MAIGLRPNVTKKLANSLFLTLNFWWLFKKLSAVKGLTSILWKLFLLPKWRKWPITPIYFTFQQTYWVHAFSKCLSNPLTIGDGYIRHFRKILPFLLKSRVLLLSLHLYTTQICVRLSIKFKINRRQISGIDGNWASPKRHQNVNKLNFLVTFKKITRSQGVNKHSVKIVFVAKMT